MVAALPVRVTAPVVSSVSVTKAPSTRLGRAQVWYRNISVAALAKLLVYEPRSMLQVPDDMPAAMQAACRSAEVAPANASRLRSVPVGLLECTKSSIASA